MKSTGPLFSPAYGTKLLRTEVFQEGVLAVAQSLLGGHKEDPDCRKGCRVWQSGLVPSQIRPLAPDSNCPGPLLFEKWSLKQENCPSFLPLVSLPLFFASSSFFRGFVALFRDAPSPYGLWPELKILVFNGILSLTSSVFSFALSSVFLFPLTLYWLKS